MTKLLVISDVHGRSFWKEAVEKYKDEVDKIIFLGDYLDRYEHEDISRKQEKENFKEILDFKLENKDKVVMLLGNHDEHYIDRAFPRSTRHSSSNAYSYREMFSSHKSFFKLAHEETVNGKKILFTHAGVMNSWLERNKETIGELTVDNLNKLLDNPSGIRVLSDISKYRTWLGEKSGSILWSDVREKLDIDILSEEMSPNEDSIVEGYDYQIFGHTQLAKGPIINDKWACLDCRRAFIINENGEIEEC